jgi:hypothetical protein
MKKYIFPVLCMINSICVQADDICPSEISTVQSLKNEIPMYDAILDDVANVLTSVSFFYGHPSDMASLMPDEDISKNKEEKMIWNFENTDKIYVVCKYSGTSVRLIKNIKYYSRCVVSYNMAHKLVGGGYSLSSISCSKENISK